MSELERLNEVDFVDLYLGSDYCEMFQETSAGQSRRIPLPETYDDMVVELRERCEDLRTRCGGDEFSLVLGRVRYRVTTTLDSHRNPLFALRKASASLRRLPELGLSPLVIRTLMNARLEGLVLIVGGPGSGKTSSAATIVHERLTRFGGLGQTIEQPIEINLEGQVGDNGRLTQEEIFHEEQYAQALVKAMRLTSKVVFMGELRYPEAALQAIVAGISGKLVVTTLHGKSVEDGIERLAALASAAAVNTPIDPYALLTSGLKLVIHQELVPVEGVKDGRRRLVTRSLSLAEEKTRAAIQSKIRDRRIAALIQEIDQQHQASQWGPDNNVSSAGTRLTRVGAGQG